MLCCVVLFKFLVCCVQCCLKIVHFRCDQYVSLLCCTDSKCVVAQSESIFKSGYCSDAAKIVYEKKVGGLLCSFL